MKNADQARDDSMEEILASIRKIIADDEAGGVALDPRSPVAPATSLEVGNLEAAFVGEPFFDLGKSATQHPALSKTQPQLPAAEDIMDLSEDFLVAEGEFDNPFLAPSPFQTEPRRNSPEPTLRIEPNLSSSAHERSFTPSPILGAPSEQSRNVPEAEAPADERRLWDGQPPTPLRAQRTETELRQRPVASFEKLAPDSFQSTPAPKPAPAFSNGASGSDFSAKSIDQTPLRPPSRQGWAGPREISRDSTPGFEPRPRAASGLEENSGEPFWAQPDLDANALTMALHTQAPRKEQAPAAKEPMSQMAPAPAAPLENIPAPPPLLQSRLSAPVTQSGLTTVSMPHLPDSLSNGPIPSISADGEAGGRPQYFEAMAEELVRATVHGLGDRELTQIGQRALTGAQRPELRTIAESFAETMSHSAFMSEPSPRNEESTEDAALYAMPEEQPNAPQAPTTAVHLPRAAMTPSQAPETLQAVPNAQKSFEESFKELLKPMLTDWLNENMPRLLESGIQQEMERRSVLKRT
ncbi:MAG: DUF2497 domain-containing protein [Chitinophagales bacterium]|nr:DUF2497 domain-containing protein [Hyphomicrobiales bacterium]